MNTPLQAIAQKAIQAFQVGDFDEANSILKGVLQTDINSANTIFELGISYAEANKISEAIFIFNCLHYFNIRDQKISYNLGFLYAMQREFESALQSFDRAIESNPNDLDTLVNYGNILHELKRFDEALAYYDKVLTLQGDYEQALYNKGNTLHELRRFDEAISQYDKALSLMPDNPEALNNKGLTLHELRRYDEAISQYDKALSLMPDNPEALNNKGLTLHDLKRFDEAIACYEKAINLKSNINWAHGNLLHAKMKIGSWAGLADSLDIISNKVVLNEKVSEPFPLLALSDDALLNKKCSEIFTQDKHPVNSELGPISKRSNNEKIRIAYFSSDFRNHPVSFLASELFEIHNRDRFEVFAFSLHKAAIRDEMNLRLRQGFDRFIDVENMLDSEIAKLVRVLGVDIAVDLTGPTQYSRTGIFAYRAAPIQVNYLGYPGTIGADYIDYIIADRTLIPIESQSCYSEKVVYLPNSYQVNDRKRVISDKVYTRRELGLPESGFVFCCFNNNFKILPTTFASWMRILKAVEGSVLWLFEDNPWVVNNLKSEALNHGIEASRLVFAERMPLSEHLARHRQADLFLDTLPYNAHTTASDALWAGLPVLTLMGRSFASRVAASLLNAIDLPELITNTQEEYEALAIGLAMNPQKLADIKLKLANNRLATPLFDTPIFTKNIEAAYIKMYDRYQADLQPDHISIT